MEDILIRQFYVSDMLSLHKMYESLSEESKRFFHPGFLGFENINLSWILVQLLLVASAVSFIRRLFSVYSYLLPLVAINDRNEIVAFGYLWVKKSKAMMGIGVKDAYQGREIGSNLLKKLLGLGRMANIGKIVLTVRTDNVKAMHFYEKHGFKKVMTIENGDIWQMRKYDCIEMSLDLHKARTCNYAWSAP